MARHTPQASSIPDDLPVARYRASLSLFALLMAFLSFMSIVVAERPAVTTLVATMTDHSASPRTVALPVVAQVLGIPLLSAIAAYFLAAQAIRFLRLFLYMRALHAYAERYLRTYAPLHARGLDPRFVRFGADGRATTNSEMALIRLIAAESQVLVLGEQGAGKTVAILHAAAELTRRRAVVRVFLGRAALPVLISLAAYSFVNPETENRLLEYMKRQMSVFGSTGLVAGLPNLLRRGRVRLLLDGLDTVPVSERLVLCQQLADVAARAKRTIACVATCQMRAYLSETRSVSPLNHFTRVTLSGLTEIDAAQALRSVKSPASATRPHRNALASTLSSHGLVATLTLPATLASLLTIWASTRELPVGRGQLYRAAVQLGCEQCGTEELPSATVQDMLGAFASALRAASQVGVYIAPGVAIGKAVAEWSAQNQPLPPNEFSSADEQILAPSTAEGVCAAAIRLGVLFLSPDGRFLMFRNQVVASAFAASWLRDKDDERARLNPELLQSHWTLPLLLWAGASDTPAFLATRLFQLSATPDVTSVRAHLTAREDVPPVTLAAALAASVEGFAATLAATGVTGDDQHTVIATAEQMLAGLLDEAARYMERPDNQDRLATALQQIEHDAGPEFVANIAHLIQVSTLSRLVRARLVTILGLLASPAALDVVIHLLDEPDAVLRQAVNQAVVLAGVAALEPLNAALNDPSERVRARAGEALTLLGPVAVDTAVETLHAADPRQRAAAAHTLGLLRAGPAVEPLRASLDDPSPLVRIAAAHALGATGTQPALAALESHLVVADAELREATAQAIGMSRDPNLLTALLPLLDDVESPVRAAAATALGTLADDRATPALQEHRDDADPLVQNAVLSALRRLGRG